MINQKYNKNLGLNGSLGPQSLVLTRPLKDNHLNFEKKRKRKKKPISLDIRLNGKVLKHRAIFTPTFISKHLCFLGMDLRQWMSGFIAPLVFSQARVELRSLLNERTNAPINARSNLLTPILKSMGKMQLCVFDKSILKIVSNDDCDGSIFHRWSQCLSKRSDIRTWLGIGELSRKFLNVAISWLDFCYYKQWRVNPRRKIIYPRTKLRVKNIFPFLSNTFPILPSFNVVILY